MKCSKCGTECKDTQTFCLCCGSPLKEEQENYYMEEELANSVGALLDEFDDEEDDDIEDFAIRFDDEAEKVHKELQVENIYSNSRRKASGVEQEEDDWDYDADKYFEDMKEMSDLNSAEEPRSEKEQEHKKEKKPVDVKKKKRQKAGRVAMACVVVVMVLALTIVIGLLVSEYMHNNLSSYEDYHKAAMTSSKDGDYKTAISHIKKAINKAENAKNTAKSDKDKEEANKNLIDARLVLNDFYVESEQMDSDYESNLLAIIALDDTKVDAHVRLAEYYADKQPKVMTDFLRTIRDDNTEVLDALSKYIVKKPKADKESGSYNEQFLVTLSAESSSTIAYTIDGSDPSIHGVTYTQPIQITKFRAEADADEEEGVTVIKAIAISQKGVESKVVEYKYEIVMASAEPQVVPESGRYDDYTDIVVTVPEGAKCYYTISEDVSDPQNPDATSNLYIASEEDMPEDSEEEFEPLQMQRGTHTMKFIIIDKNGIVSEVAKRTYILDIEPKVTINSAEDLIVEKMKEEKLIEGEELKNAAGNTYTIQYRTKIIDDNQEYYIYEVKEGNEKQPTVSMKLYAVNSYDETVIMDIKYEDEKYVIPELEDEEDKDKKED